MTVHRVDDGLDSGPILLQRAFALDLMPEGDPLRYLGRLQREVLVPAGAAMMAEAVGLEARGETVAVPQPVGGRVRRRATWAQQRELRRVVARRRLGRDDRSAQHISCTEREISGHSDR